jgi:glycosyltransferase involved in cell wall biosynthesis
MVMGRILRSFDHIVYSTAFQRSIHVRTYPRLPAHSVIENAVPAGSPVLHRSHTPFRLLALSRLVGFKNISSLLSAVRELPEATLTIVGDGPLRIALERQVAEMKLVGRVSFRPPVRGEEKARVLQEHDLLVIPSITEISPNAALEARSAGLPVLLTQETGLSAALTVGMVLSDLSTPDAIADAVRSVISRYDDIAKQASVPMKQRGWAEVADEFILLMEQSLDSYFLCSSNKESTQRKCVCADSLSANPHLRRTPPIDACGQSSCNKGRLLMISGDRSMTAGKKGAFWYTLEEMSKHWERIDVICPKAQIAHCPLPTTHYNNVFFHPSPHRLWYQPLWIRRKGIELVAAHHHTAMTVHEYPPFYNGIGARLLRRHVRLPTAVEIHHIIGWPVVASFSERIGFWMSRLLLPSHLRHFDAVRVVSRVIGEKLRSWGVPSENIRLVPSFYLDADALRPDPTIEKKFDLAFCGRIVSNKGLGSLLRALPELPAVTLLVIGDGPDRLAMERLAVTIGVAGRVTFSGWLPTQQDVIRSLASAKIFVLPSLSEGGPRVALEAMAIGLPVIATRVGVLPDVIEDGRNGVFTTGDSADLRERISLLLADDKKREAIGREATAILKRFERKQLIREYAEFLQKC